MRTHRHSPATASVVGRALVRISLVGTLALAGCGGGGGGGSSGSNGVTNPPPPVGPNQVTVQNNSFNPTTVTVSPGTTVTWTWNTCSDPGYGSPGTCVAHNIVWDADGSGSGMQSEGNYARTFNTAGTYAYHCAVHGAAMSGTVKVQ